MDSLGFWNALLGACALVLVVEGVLPFISPPAWRTFFERATKLTDGQLRFMGLSSMLAGLLVLFVVWS